MGRGVDLAFLIAATLLAAVGGALGMRSLHHGRRSKATVFWMIAVFVAQLGFLSIRGQARGACPLVGIGEILVFLAWSLTLIYLLVGPTYRLSLLGVFSAPVIVLFQGVALIPGVLDPDPTKVATTDAWRETHSAMSVLGYGALALAAVSSVMFLVLDRQLKDHHLASGLFRNLPPVRELLVSGRRLLWLGWGMLTIGVAAGFLMERDGGGAHLVAAVAVWVAYAALVGVAQFRGLTGRKFSVLCVVLFVASLSVFALV
ncbi:cytochrome c biogenesis protein CcsA [Haloferula helveola]